MAALRRRRTLLILAVVSCLGGLLVRSEGTAAAALTSLSWGVSSATTNASGVTYTYKFTVPTTISVTKVTMTVPSGTLGSPTVGSVKTGGGVPLTAGSVSLTGTTVTLNLLTLFAGGVLIVVLNGFVNTSTPGAYSSTITATGTSSNSGTTPTVTLANGLLASPTWSSSSLVLGAPASYTYGFTTGSVSTLRQVTMTLPSGTKGAPTVGSATPAAFAAGATVTSAGNTLTYAFNATTAPVPAGTAVSITINGLTNTTVKTTSAATISTVDVGGSGSGVVDSGTTPQLSFTGQLTLVPPASLSWATVLNGNNQTVVDTASADQALSVNDNTGTSAGWHVTVSATTFVAGAHSLPAVGTLVYTGSLTSIAAITAPTAACVATCTIPADTTTYPVAISTATTSPPPSVIYDTAVGTGVGPMTIGASGSANPGGWWVAIPANAYRGAYTSTVTFAIVAGP